jgi:signal transduction histidine kinase
MEFPPFGVDESGQKIRDVSGVTIRANVEYLEEMMDRARGPGAGADMVDRLVSLLNGRILDPTYHVTPDFLKNPWNSYSYEFACFLGEFCSDLSRDTQFQSKMARQKFLSSLVVALGKPFSIAKIYELFPHFGQKFAKDSLEFQVQSVTPGRAVLRMAFTERVVRQFGPYRNACAVLVCDATKSALASAPERIHGRLPATVQDLTCMAEGAPSCEWELTWEAEEPSFLTRVTSRRARGLHNSRPENHLIQEQLKELESRHEQLREAYLDQQLATVELRRRLRDVTALSRQVEELNVGLEAKVKERTAELERVNQELQVANQRLKELDQLKSSFVSIASHELRTPMTSIKGYVDNLLEGIAGTLTAKQTAYLTRIRHNADRLTRLITDLLDLSKIESGQVPFKPAPIPLPELIGEVVETLQPLAKQKGLTLQTKSLDDKAVLQADRDKLTQVLTNLIQNAIKFTEAGGTVTIEGGLNGKGYAALSVADTGCGIPPEEVGKVFDKFFRGGQSAPQTPGAGLGLAIAKSLVERHGGEIWVDSAPGAGSRFSFTVPTASSYPLKEDSAQNS